jgi:hypothetical protein
VGSGFNMFLYWYAPGRTRRQGNLRVAATIRHSTYATGRAGAGAEHDPQGGRLSKRSHVRGMSQQTKCSSDTGLKRQRRDTTRREHLVDEGSMRYIAYTRSSAAPGSTPTHHPR